MTLGLIAVSLCHKHSGNILPRLSAQHLCVITHFRSQVFSLSPNLIVSSSLSIRVLLSKKEKKMLVLELPHTTLTQKAICVMVYAGCFVFPVLLLFVLLLPPARPS